MVAVPVSPAHIARIRFAGSYCTGTLISPDTVLTCAHIFRGREFQPGGALCEVAGTRRTVAAPRMLPGTDVALVTLSHPVHLDHYPRLGPPPPPLSRVAAFGLGGVRHPRVRLGRFITPLPVAISRSLATVVRPAGIVVSTPQAIKGDSGGPLLHDAHIFAIQSLILDPLGVNLGIATVSLVGGLDPQSL